MLLFLWTKCRNFHSYFPTFLCVKFSFFYIEGIYTFYWNVGCNIVNPKLWRQHLRITLDLHLYAKRISLEIYCVKLQFFCKFDVWKRNDNQLFKLVDIWKKKIITLMDWRLICYVSLRNDFYWIEWKICIKAKL